MHVRSPRPDDEPPGGSARADDGLADHGETMGDAGGMRAPGRRHGASAQVSFTVPAGVAAAKFAAAAVLAVATALANDNLQLLVGGSASMAILAYALRDVLARERLRADVDGVVAVAGYARRRRVFWSHVDAVRVNSAQRFGARTALLELDAGEEIFLFSRFDLGVDPEEAVRLLALVSQRGQGCGSSQNQRDEEHRRARRGQPL